MERERLCAPTSPGRKQASAHALQTLSWIVSMKKGPGVN
jgi:hypothetical protein